MSPKGWSCTRPRGHSQQHEAIIVDTQEYLETWGSGIKERWDNLPTITRQRVLKQIGEPVHGDTLWNELPVMVQIKIYKEFHHNFSAVVSSLLH